MSAMLIAGRYRVGEHLDSVNHSEFHEGYDTQVDEKIIIRLIDLDQSNKAFQPKLQGFMDNELRVVKKLNHPNILKILDYGLEGHVYYQVNEYVPFETLATYVQLQGRLDVKTALKFGLEIADILSHLHKIGIIHCDVKPENILVNEGSIKLMEFSIANHILDGERTTGTPPYMSPEAALGESAAVTRDVWALGIVLFELLTGRVPYLIEGRMNDPAAMPELLAKIVREPVPPITDLAAGLSPRLVVLVNWMLEKEPERRISSMRQISAELEGILADIEHHTAALSVGDVIGGRYRLQTAIAEGGFGQVFRGADLMNGTTVAIKQLKPDLANNPQTLARFKRESDILSQLNHPGIVKVLDTVELGDRHYIVMQYIEGGDLRARLKNGALPLSETLPIALELADALARAHHISIIHRDIKPENVLIAADGTPRLTDFGIAYIEDAPRLTETGSLPGTLQYIAPEVFNGESPSKLSDIWSFGILLYEMIAGNHPFANKSVAQLVLAILNDPVPPLIESSHECPEKLSDLVANMLERDPAKRIGSMREIAARLEQR